MLWFTLSLPEEKCAVLGLSLPDEECAVVGLSLPEGKVCSAWLKPTGGKSVLWSGLSLPEVKVCCGLA